MIDNEVYGNYISLKPALKLNLKFDLHLTPHYLDDENFLINRQCNIPFKIGLYEDSIQCDVIDIQSTYILLSRS